MKLTKFSEIGNIPPIQEQLKAGLKTIAMSNYPSALDAALEIIDNSVDERDESNPPLLLQISIPVRKDKITFFDSHSLGMGYSELNSFLQWGFSTKRGDKGKIGKYGAGGKGAIGYLGIGCEIRTKRKGEDIIWELSESNWRDEELKTLQPSAVKSDVPPEVGFTQIDIFGVDRKINKEELKRILSYIYKPLLEKNLVDITVEGLKVEPAIFPTDQNEQVESFLENTKYGQLSGWFGKLAPKSGMRGGVRCYYNGRLITKDYRRIQEFFGHPDPQYVGSMNFLIGELHLDFVPVLPNKTDFDRDSEEWKWVEDYIHTKLNSIVVQLRNRKEEIEVNAEDYRNLPEVQNLVMAAFTAHEKRDFQGPETTIGDDRGRKPPTPQPEAQVTKVPLPEQTRTTPTPSTPPPSISVGTLMRSKGFPKFDVKPGDGLSRANLIEEEGIKKLVFDKVFPEYLSRDGDVLYKAEAAIMQLVKPLSEDINMAADEYIETVDRLISEVIKIYNAKRAKIENIELEDVVS